MTEEKRPVGRPSEYKAEYCDQVIELGRDGKSPAQIAAALDVARMTLYLWADAHPEFMAAFTRARDLAQAWFEDKGQEGLFLPGFNASLWSKQVSSRYPDDYTEKRQLEHSGFIEKKPDDWLESRIAELAAKAGIVGIVGRAGEAPEEA